MKEVFGSARREYTIEAFPIEGPGKWRCAVYSRHHARGVALFEPDAEYVHGRLVPVDTVCAAVAGG